MAVIAVQGCGPHGSRPLYVPAPSGLSSPFGLTGSTDGPLAVGEEEARGRAEDWNEDAADLITDAGWLAGGGACGGAWGGACGGAWGGALGASPERRWRDLLRYSSSDTWNTRTAHQQTPRNNRQHVEITSCCYHLQTSVKRRPHGPVFALTNFPWQVLFARVDGEIGQVLSLTSLLVEKRACQLFNKRRRLVKEQLGIFLRPHEQIKLVKVKTCSCGRRLPFFHVSGFRETITHQARHSGAKWLVATSKKEDCQPHLIGLVSPNEEKEEKKSGTVIWIRKGVGVPSSCRACQCARPRPAAGRLSSRALLCWRWSPRQSSQQQLLRGWPRGQPGADRSARGQGPPRSSSPLPPAPFQGRQHSALVGRPGAEPCRWEWHLARSRTAFRNWRR